VTYDVEMGSDAMLYIQSFIQIGLAIQNICGGFTDTQTAWR
jgi:hypothetical protein